MSTLEREREREKTYRFISEYFAIGLASFVGVSIRQGLVNAVIGYKTYNSSAYYSSYVEIFRSQPYLVPNIIGSFLIGIFYSNIDRIIEASPVLYKSLTIGLCGCLTSFSTWMVSSMATPFEAHAWLILIVEFTIVWCALCAGFSFTSVMNNISKFPSANNLTGPSGEESMYETTTLEVTSKVVLRPSKVKTVLYLTIISFAVVMTGLIIALIVTEIYATEHNAHQRTILRAVCLAPVGCWLRLFLAQIPQIRESYPQLYLYTLAANIIAVVISTLLMVYAKDWSWTPAINSGFNGSLSTVSTFLVELHLLYANHGPLSSLRYLLVSVVASVIIVSIIRL